jgi:hypothetical protein
MEESAYSMKPYPASRFNEEFIKKKRIDGEEELGIVFPYDIVDGILDNERYLRFNMGPCLPTSSSHPTIPRTAKPMSNHYSSVYIKNSSDKWFTPPFVIDSIVHMIRKPIDLDPTSEVAGLKL